VLLPVTSDSEWGFLMIRVAYCCVFFFFVFFCEGVIVLFLSVFVCGMGS
jgi:hypothetical protein